MLFALRQPETLLGLVVGYLVAMFASAWALRIAAGAGRAVPGPSAPRTWLDPYGMVGALIGGVGWAMRPERRRGFGRDPRRTLWVVAVVAVVVPAALAAAGIAGYFAAGGRDLIGFVDCTAVLHGNQGIATTLPQQVALGFGVENLAIAILSLVPVPPLATGIAAWSTLPRTAGSRRLAYHLVEENWGVAVVLVLLVIPLAEPALIALVSAIGNPILHAL